MQTFKAQKNSHLGELVVSAGEVGRDLLEADVSADDGVLRADAALGAPSHVHGGIGERQPERRPQDPRPHLGDHSQQHA